MIKSIKAFFTGVVEFRLTCTTGYDDYALQVAYDKGREFAHVVTFRYFEPH